MKTWTGSPAPQKEQKKYHVTLVWWTGEKDTYIWLAMQLMNDSLILSHLQFGMICWGFVWNMIFKLQKRAIRIRTNKNFNAHNEPMFKELKMLMIKYIFDIQCLKFWFKFENNCLTSFFKSTLKYNHELHDIETRNRNKFHLFPTRTEVAYNVLRHYIPELLQQIPAELLNLAHTHSINAFTYHLKGHIIISYNSTCIINNCYVCNNGDN